MRFGVFASDDLSLKPLDFGDFWVESGLHSGRTWAFRGTDAGGVFSRRTRDECSRVGLCIKRHFVAIGVGKGSVFEHRLGDDVSAKSARTEFINPCQEGYSLRD